MHSISAVVEKPNHDVIKTKFMKLWNWAACPERIRKKCLLAINEPVSANWWGDVSNVMLR